MVSCGEWRRPPVAIVGFVTPEIAAPVGFVPNANEIGVLVVTMFPYASDTSADGGCAQAKPARQENGGFIASVVAGPATSARSPKLELGKAIPLDGRAATIGPTFNGDGAVGRAVSPVTVTVQRFPDVDAPVTVIAIEVCDCVVTAAVDAHVPGPFVVTATPTPPAWNSNPVGGLKPKPPVGLPPVSMPAADSEKTGPVKVVQAVAEPPTAVFALIAEPPAACGTMRTCPVSHT